MKKKYAVVLAGCLPLFAFTLTSKAQRIAEPAQENISLKPDHEGDDTRKKETLSGINLQPAANGGFQLDFSQQLDENAMLAIKNSTGKVVFRKPLNVADNKSSWRYNVGKLRPDTYLIEVKTSDTTYWTRFKIGK